MADDAQGVTIYAGVDEAGYGPMLGPLCVAMSVFRVDKWTDDRRAPDLWRRLRRSVCREPKRASAGLLAVNDSKVLKLPNGDARRHPLTHLERGVLAFLTCRADRPSIQTDEALFDALGARLPGVETHPWYGDAPGALPVSTTSAHVRVSGVGLGGTMRSAGVELLDLSCRLLDERGFNERLSNLGVKSRVAMELVGALIRRLWRSDAADAHPPARLVLDRQGGRISYAEALAEQAPEARIEVVRESAAASVYELRSADASSSRAIRLHVMTEAEQRHLPVALASMTAKLVRELCMARFNRFWCGRVAELKPTAGYRTDARRWLADAARLGAARETELRALCRDA